MPRQKLEWEGIAGKHELAVLWEKDIGKRLRSTRELRTTVDSLLPKRPGGGLAQLQESGTLVKSEVVRNGYPKKKSLERTEENTRARKLPYIKLNVHRKKEAVEPWVQGK